ncbi:MAG: hypothetical protein H0U49_00775 [Parachlamydiaceae bacterium]|nr:hypothetical protein [Parachlamydiaceae bacterium]
MLKNPRLRNIEKYRNSNKGAAFILFEYIHNEMELNKINTDIYFALLEFYWPSFISYKGYVFLKEEFTEEYFNTLESQDSNIELWINLLSIDGYFENDEDWDEKASALSRKLVEIWQLKLKKDFPQLDFVVLYLEDREVGDYGLTFYQKKYEKKKP